jgi:peptide/nickel transport system substrate-binding protein
MDHKQKIHPAIPELKDQMEKGKLSRREFMRYSALLGLSVTAAGQLAGMILPKKAAAAGIKRGGVLRVSQQVQKIDHPARFSWLMPSNATRQIWEYMTYTDENNVSHPYLCESWNASDDLKTWTFNVRKGVKFNNGDTFTADDCILPSSSGWTMPWALR